MKHFFIQLGLGLVLLTFNACNKEKSYPSNINGYWNLESIQTLKIDVQKVKRKPVNGDNFLRLKFESNDMVFDSYFSWDSFVTYTTGNSGTFWFSNNFSTLIMSFGSTEQIDYSIIRLTSNKMILQAETVNDLDGLLHLEEYVYKRVNWTP